MQLCYGLDIGGTKIELVACDSMLEVHHRHRIDTPTQDYAAFVEAVAALVETADADKNKGLSRSEYATTAPKPRAPKPACSCG